jgi:hypothetical protein
VTAGKSAEWLADRHPPWCVKAVLSMASVGETHVDIKGTSTSGSLVCTEADEGIAVSLDDLQNSDAPGTGCALSVAEGRSETELALVRCRTPSHAQCLQVQLFAEQVPWPVAGLVRFLPTDWTAAGSLSLVGRSMVEFGDGCCRGAGLSAGSSSTTSLEGCEAQCTRFAGCSAISYAEAAQRCVVHNGPLTGTVQPGGPCPGFATAGAKCFKKPLPLRPRTTG